jgi:hypothetical protein
MSVRALTLNGDHEQGLEDYRAALLDGSSDPLELQQMYEELETSESDVDDANLLADVFWGGTAVFGVVWLILAIANDTVEQEQSSATFSVAASEDGGGVFARIPWGGP